MAEERLSDNTPTTAASKPVAKKKKQNKIVKWFRDMRAELKKVTWPSKKQLVNNTLVVLVVELIAALILWGFDTLGSAIVDVIFSIF